jgi:hypothetical protein
MIRLFGAALLLGATLWLTACGQELRMRVEKIDETRTMDNNGNTFITTNWAYADGEKVTTTTIINRNGNDVRREDPPRRTFSFDL